MKKQTRVQALATSVIVTLRYDAHYGVAHLTHDRSNQEAIERLAQIAIDDGLGRAATVCMIARELRAWECGI